MRALVSQHRWLFSTLDIGEATHVILHPRCPATIVPEPHSYPLQPGHKKENFFTHLWVSLFHLPHCRYYT